MNIVLIFPRTAHDNQAVQAEVLPLLRAAPIAANGAVSVQYDDEGSKKAILRG